MCKDINFTSTSEILHFKCYQQLLQLFERITTTQNSKPRNNHIFSLYFELFSYSIIFGLTFKKRTILCLKKRHDDKEEIGPPKVETTQQVRQEIFCVP